MNELEILENRKVFCFGYLNVILERFSYYKDYGSLYVLKLNIVIVGGRFFFKLLLFLMVKRSLKIL